MARKSGLTIKIVAGVLVVIVALGIWWIVSNSERIGDFINGTKLYTYENVQKASEDGYKQGIGDKQAYQKQITQLAEQLGISELTIQEMNLTINQMQEIIEAYESSNGNYVIAFIVDGITVDTQVIAPNGSPSNPTPPEKYMHQFIGWSIDGTTIINPAETPITENITFVAVFKLWSIVWVAPVSSNEFNTPEFPASSTPTDYYQMINGVEFGEYYIELDGLYGINPSLYIDKQIRITIDSPYPDYINIGTHILDNNGSYTYLSTTDDYQYRLLARMIGSDMYFMSSIYLMGIGEGYTFKITKIEVSG